MVMSDPSGDRIFVINLVGICSKSRSMKLELPVYRAMLVTESNENEDDTNKLLVAVKIIEDNQSIVCRNLKTDTRKNDSMVGVANIVRVQKHFSIEGRYVVALDYMDMGSMHELLVRKFDGLMPEKWILYILHQVSEVIAAVHSENECISYLCASHVYINGKGEVKTGYGASVVELFGDASNVSWNYLKPSQIWELAPPGLDASTGKEVDIWRFGVLALELIYCGLRFSDEETALFQINGMCKNGELPQTLIDMGSKKKKTHQFHMGEIPKLHIPKAPFPAWTKKAGASSSTPEGGIPLKEPGRKGRISTKLQKLILDCLSTDPTKRPKAEVLTKDPVFHSSKHKDGASLLWKRKMS